MLNLLSRNLQFSFSDLISVFMMETSSNSSPLLKLVDIILKHHSCLNKREAYSMIWKVRQVNGGKLVGLKQSKFLKIVSDIMKERDDNERKKKKKEKEFACRLKRTCPFCFRWFIEKFSRDRHINIHHKKANIRSKPARELFKCSICGKVFTHKTSQVRHTKTHEKKVVQFSCDQCEKIFSRKDNLFQHRERIHGLYKVNLDAIVDSGAGFECEMCKENFGKDSESFKTHIIKKVCVEEGSGIEVTKDGCYQCKKCDKAFYDKTSLTRHIKCKHKEEDLRFECSVCKTMFGYKCTLKKHIKKFHKDE